VKLVLFCTLVEGGFRSVRIYLCVFEQYDTTKSTVNSQQTNKPNEIPAFVTPSVPAFVEEKWPCFRLRLQEWSVLEMDHLFAGNHVQISRMDLDLINQAASTKPPRNMPPRLQLAWRMPTACLTPQLRPALPALSTLLARLSLSQTARHAHILGTLSDIGASKTRRRLGRGPSSGRGKTAGRGQKGQWAHGKVKPRFQGGQTPLIVTLGKRGKDNL
jgi:hypothetical protein